MYLLLHREQPRFKLGWSNAPQQRIRSLPEFDELDLDASRLIWLPSRRRAEQVERSMHKLLWPYRADPRHASNGHSEWFGTRAWDLALQLLSAVPLDGDPAQLARVHPFGSVPEDPPLRLGSTSAEDTWLRIEDLLRRLARHVPMRLEPGPAPRLRLVGLRRAWHGPLAELRSVVVDAETYQFRRRGRVHAFVQWLSYDGDNGDDFVLQFAPLAALAAWDSEVYLPAEVQTLLQWLDRREPERDPPPAEDTQRPQ